MKLLRPLAAILLSVGTLVSPFCPMAAQMAQAAEMRTDDSAIMASHEAHMDAPMAPCCLMDETAHHADERHAVFSFAPVTPCIVPDAFGQAIERPSSHRESCFLHPKSPPHKFESRSHNKRE